MAFLGMVKMEAADANEYIAELMYACAVTINPNEPFGDDEKQLYDSVLREAKENQGSSVFPKIKKIRKQMKVVNENAAIKISKLVSEENWTSARHELSEVLHKRIALSILGYTNEFNAGAAFDEAKQLIFETVPVITDRVDDMFTNPDKLSVLQEVSQRILRKWTAMGLVYRS